MILMYLYLFDSDSLRSSERVLRSYVVGSSSLVTGLQAGQKTGDAVPQDRSDRQVPEKER